MRHPFVAMLCVLLVWGCASPPESAQAGQVEPDDPSPAAPEPEPITRKAKPVQDVPEATDPLPGGVLPLTDSQRSIVWSAPEDEVPDSRVDRRHYVHTNEKKHHIFFPYMDCLDGGAYLGVGSDQNYTMLARCRASHAWIVDYDQVIPLVHRINRALILESPTSRQFVKRWKKRKEQASLEIIRTHEKDDPRLPQMEEIFVKYRQKLHEHFQRMARRKARGEPSTWLADEQDYQYIRGMFMADRIRPMLGNLLADRAVAGVGEACRQLDVPLRVIYLTNVEELVHYNDAFRNSFRSLPVDEKSVVLRTLAYTNGYFIADHKWHYNIQSARDFQERLKSKVSRIQVFMQLRKERPAGGISTLGI